MEARDQHTDSYYAATAPAFPALPALAGDTRADVCVVGGGFTGLSAALHLARAGRKVVLLEQARIGWGASGRNGGQVHWGFRWDQTDLEAKLGMGDARALWDLCVDAHAHLLALIHDERIDCDWRAGLLHLDHRARMVPHSHAYADHIARTYGYDGYNPVTRDEARMLVASDAYHGGVFSRDSGHLHPLKLCLGIARAAQAAGATLHEQSAATSIQRKDQRWHVATSGGGVSADHVLLACNGYLHGLNSVTERHVMPINNFIATTEPIDHPHALIQNEYAVADSRFVVYYFRMTPDNRLLFGGGENYSYAFPDDIKATVRRHILRVFPQLQHVGLSHGWGGTLAVTPTRLPFVRQLEPGLFASSGYSGQGVMLAPYFGKLIADTIIHGSEQFDLLARLPVPSFPGGKLLRWPILVSAMLALRIRDMI